MAQTDEKIAFTRGFVYLLIFLIGIMFLLPGGGILTEEFNPPDV